MAKTDLEPACFFASTTRLSWAKRLLDVPLAGISLTMSAPLCGDLAGGKIGARLSGLLGAGAGLPVGTALPMVEVPIHGAGF